MKKFKSLKDKFQDGINIRKSNSVKSGKNKRKVRQEINELVSEYFAKENESQHSAF